MQVEDVLGADLAAELADRLEERLRLDVADRAADLGDDDVGGGRLGDRADARLDLVRDVRDHLHGRAEVLALALLAQHAVPDAAGGVVRGPREVLVDEALVVADVEIGLGAVLGDEHLAVLERAHRPRVDVEVRVELLHLHLQPARLEQAAERGGGDPLAERRDDAAGDEDELGLVVALMPGLQGRKAGADPRAGSRAPTVSARAARPTPVRDHRLILGGGQDGRRFQSAAAVWTRS